MKKSRLLGAVSAAALLFTVTQVGAALIPLPELEGYYSSTGGMKTLPDGTEVMTRQSRTVMFSYPVESTADDLVVVSFTGLIVNWPLEEPDTADFWMHALYEEPQGFNPPTSIRFALVERTHRIGHNSSNPPWTGLTLRGPMDSPDGTVIEITSVILDDPTVVPIPSAVWLFGSGLLGLVGMARRKKA